jgi:signal transduction histidine kinase
MRERALIAGGHLDITSAPERGTSVVARIPLSGKLGASSIGGRESAD